MTHHTKSEATISISGAINRPATSFGRVATTGCHRCTYDFLVGNARHTGSGSAAATSIDVSARGGCRPNAGRPTADCPAAAAAAATATASPSTAANVEPPPPPSPPPSSAAASDVHGPAVRGEGAS